MLAALPRPTHNHNTETQIQRSPLLTAAYHTNYQLVFLTRSTPYNDKQFFARSKSTFAYDSNCHLLHPVCIVCNNSGNSSSSSSSSNRAHELRLKNLSLEGAFVTPKPPFEFKRKKCSLDQLTLVAPSWESQPADSASRVDSSRVKHR